MPSTTLAPGPPPRFLAGHLNALRRDMLELYLRTARTCGDVDLLRYGLRRVSLVSHPDLIEQVLASRKFMKHYALQMVRPLLGNGILTSEGDFWLKQRRLMPPVFLKDRVLSYAGTMIG